MKRIVLAIDSFKGTFGSAEIHSRFTEFVNLWSPTVEVISIPMADGGEGTLEVIKHAIPGIASIQVEVKHPLTSELVIQARYLRDGRTAFLEMAQTTGLHCIDEAFRNPLKTSTYGFGQLIRHVVQSGVNTLYIGIGGSCTNDGGIGMLQALGAEFSGVDLTRPLCGEDLEVIEQVNLAPVSRWRAKHELTVYVICDVDNPLTGENGATYTFGRQKGATEAMLHRLEKGMCHYEEILNRPDISHLKGAGAAGGVGMALALGLNAKLLSGANVLMDFCHFDEHVQGDVIVITGEGSVDVQSLRGKVPVAVLKRAKRSNQAAQVYLLAGQLGSPWHTLNSLGFSGYSVCSEQGVVATTELALNLALDEAIQKLIKQLPLENS